MWKNEIFDLSLLDDDFLSALIEQKEHEIYARIAALDINELPIDYIEGKVTGGSISLDGDSSVRRTCNLTMVTNDIDINDFYWGIKTKFKLEIGLKNNLLDMYAPGDYYPDIVWFKQGIFVLSTFNTSISTNSCTISVSGKDKMCLLNGELGGQLFASIDFGTEEIQNKIFSKVSSIDATSDVLIGRKYYFIPEDDETLDTIAANDHKYSFTLDAAGAYLKDGNYYRKCADDYVGNRYTIYQYVLQPSDLFEQVSNDFIYARDTYYYQKNEGYYILDTAISQTADRTYYRLKDLYQIDYEYNIYHIPLGKIIRESVHTYAKEPYHNIIINDLEEYGLEQLQYKGDTPLLALRNAKTEHFENFMFANKLVADRCNNFEINYNAETKEVTGYITLNGERKPFQFDLLVQEVAQFSPSLIQYDVTSKTYNYNQTYETDENLYTIAVISYGDDVGYRVTDLIYPGDLVSGIGDSLTTILDKIKQMLGDFEYFYDEDGHFVFQRKRTYVNVAWSQFVNNTDEKYVTYAKERKKFSFNFEGNRLVTAIQNSPVLSNAKNDFVVWGKRKTVNGAEIPIHARYAIDKKPTEYLAFNGILYYTEEALAELESSNRAETITNTREYALAHFQKNTDIIPSFLKNPETGESDWWEVLDWAQYYYLLVGAYPSQKLMEYGTEGFSQTLTFPNGVTHSFNNQLIIDLDKNTYNPLTQIMNTQGLLSTWNPFMHGFYGCAHTYAEYINFYKNFTNMRSYIYKPHIPKDITQDTNDENFITQIGARQVDWREIIYRMAIDFFAGQGCSDKQPVYYYYGNEKRSFSDPDHFLSVVAELNPEVYPTGYTGYEEYYTDMEGFWRQLYNPDYEPSHIYESGHYEEDITKNDGSIYYKRVKTWHDESVVGSEVQYYVPDDVTYNEFKNNSNEQYFVSYDDEKLYWNIDVFNNPESLNFWIDFFESGDELQSFSVTQIGDRTKVVNDDKVSSIIFKEIPDIIVYDLTEDYNDLRQKLDAETGYTWVRLPKGLSQYFTMSYRSHSAKNKIDELLYQYAYCVENISITSIPVYYLQPNTRIYVRDEITKINGEYIVKKVTIPLAFNGTMSISAIKAPERLY